MNNQSQLNQSNIQANYLEIQPIVDNKYVPKLGSYKPQFNIKTEKRPQDPICATLLTFFLWIILIGSWYGFYQAGITNMKNYITVVSIIYFGLIIIILAGVVSGGKVKQYLEQMDYDEKLSLLQQQKEMDKHI